jgi:protein CpxP
LDLAVDEGAGDAVLADALVDIPADTLAADAAAIADRARQDNSRNSTRARLKMTTHLTIRIGSALTASIILGAATLTLPFAATAADAVPAAASATPSTSATPAKKATAAHDPVEARVKSLHDALKITASQEPQWQAVADVMRENAKTTGDLIEERARKAKTLTAIDDLHSYEAITEAHTAGVKKLIPAVEALYATMSDAEKKNADAVFGHRVQRATAKKSG